MEPNRPLSQPVTRSKPSAAAVAQALGGEPARPPALPTQKVARAVEDPALAELRAARAAEFTAAESTAPAALNTGTPTFDGIPAEVQARRAKVAAATAGLGHIISFLRKAEGELSPVLADLADDADAIKAAEFFDPKEAQEFLAALLACIPSPAAPAAPPAPES
jgi:hypothetical protein